MLSLNSATIPKRIAAKGINAIAATKVERTEVHTINGAQTTVRIMN